MTELEMTVAVAGAMLFDYYTVSNNHPQHTIRIKYRLGPNENYWPITNDAQAMAIAKKFMLKLDFFVGSAEFTDFGDGADVFRRFSDESINRAIVECVACKFAAK